MIMNTGTQSLAETKKVIINIYYNES